MALNLSRRIIPTYLARPLILAPLSIPVSPALKLSSPFSNSTSLRGSGTGGSKEPPKQDFNFYVKKGKELQAKVDAAFASLSSSHPPTDIADSTTAYNAKYVLDSATSLPPSNSNPIINALNLPAPKNWRYCGTKSQPKNSKGEAAQVAYKNYYVYDASSKTGAIIASWNYNTEDTNATKERLNLSEIFFRQYSEVSKAQPSTLAYVIRDSIEGADSLMIINTVLKGTARVNGTTFAPGTDGFNAFLGSDNGKSVAFMLLDHMNAIKKRIVGVWAKANSIYFVLGNTPASDSSSSSPKK